jgi:hypothetical protein
VVFRVHTNLAWRTMEQIDQYDFLPVAAMISTEFMRLRKASCDGSIAYMLRINMTVPPEVSETCSLELLTEAVEYVGREILNGKRGGISSGGSITSVLTNVVSLWLSYRTTPHYCRIFLEEILSGQAPPNEINISCNGVDWRPFSWPRCCKLDPVVALEPVEALTH